MKKDSIPSSLLALGLISIFQIAPAHGSEQQQEAPQRSYTWGLGLGAVVQRKGYTDIDNDSMVLPLIYFDNRWVRLIGGSLDLKLPSAGPVEFAIAGRFQNEGYKASDAPILAGMAERKESIWAGVAVNWRNGIADLSAEWLTDVLSNSGGQQIKLSAEHAFQLGSFEVTPRVGGIWLDEKYVNYYYGVRPGEALGGRSFYAGASTTNVELGIRTSYSFGRKQRLFLDVGSEMFGTEIQDSPLVNRSSQISAVVGYLYIF